MSGRFQPEHGADSVAEYRNYRVRCVDEIGTRFWMRVRAISEPAAEAAAVDKAHGQGYADVTTLAVEEVLLEASRDYADAEMQRAKEDVA